MIKQAVGENELNELVKDKMDNIEFSRRVYEIAAGIPESEVLTYGQIALIIGNPRWARRVGRAMFYAPNDIPCHRVINGKGEMAPAYAFGGEDIQREMLKNEGVIFKADGCVDMKRIKNINNMKSI